MNKSLLLFVTLLFILSCKKESSPGIKSESCSDFSLTDGSGKKLQSFIYNSENKLVKHVVYNGDSSINWSDSFAYSNGNMVKSWMSLDGNNSSKSYTTSEYDYSDSTLIRSRYYLGSTPIVRSEYESDSLGRFTSVRQYALNMTYQSTPTSVYFLHYDKNSNLKSVLEYNGVPVYSFSDYDNKPNMWYKMPFDFAYNIFDYFSHYLSPNNFGVMYKYTPPYVNYGVAIPRDSLSISYSYLYNDFNKVTKYTRVNSNGRVSNGPGSAQTVTVIYKCN